MTDYIKLEGDEIINTFGGEYDSEEFSLSEYGIDFEKVSIHGLTPKQMEILACKIISHMITCGHRFEIRKTLSIDQSEELVKIN